MAVAIVSILISIFLNRVGYYQELAEKTAMEENIGAIQSALTMQRGKQYVRGNTDEARLMTSENPVKWLQKLPQNYAGEFYDPKPNAVNPGSWLFDLKSRELVYIPKRTEHFTPEKDGGKWIHFHIRIETETIKRNEVDGKDKELVAAVFEPTQPINWFK